MGVEKIRVGETDGPSGCSAGLQCSMHELLVARRSKHTSFHLMLSNTDWYRFLQGGLRLEAGTGDWETPAAQPVADNADLVGLERGKKPARKNK